MSSSSSARRRPDLWVQHNSMVDWSNLPYDLLVLIANKLNAIDDFFAFSAVCHSWRLIHLNENWNPNDTISPWLILDVNHNGEALIRRVFNRCISKSLKLQLPDAKPRRYWGSSYGWVISIDYDLVIGLLNPISQAYINIPLNLHIRVQQMISCFDYINKANLLKIRGEFVILVTLCLCSDLYFAKTKDRRWSIVKLPYPLTFASVVCIKDEIYAACGDGTLLLVEIYGPDPPKATVITTITPNHESRWTKIHLVESLGDLLMIFQYMYNSPIVVFKVYKFDFSTRVWMIVESLGERVIFLDYSHSLSVEAGDEFRSNSIYFVDHSLGWNWGLKQDNEWKYCGVYNMEDKSIETLSLNMCNWDGCPPPCAFPSWLIPSM